jgi:phage shock protein A
MSEARNELVLKWLVNKVKELKNDVRKIKKEMDEDDEMRIELSDMLMKIVKRQNELEAKLNALEGRGDKP